MVESERCKWVRDAVPGRSFADIGGLGFHAAHEMVSLALEAGAAEATMVEVLPLDHPLWKDLDDKCERRGVRGYKKVFADLNQPGDIGPWDVVYCSGVIYHMPDPVHAMLRLRSLCRRYLVLSSMIVPPQMSGPEGDVVLGEGQVVFVPAIGGVTKSACAAHFDALEIKIFGINVDEPVVWSYGDSGVNYGPWWWLFTEEFLEHLLNLGGFRVLNREETWAARTVSFLAERM
jgi:hypothetical protein